MATFSEAVRFIRARRLLTQIAHSTTRTRYDMELSKKNLPSPVALPRWMFEEK